MQVIPYPRFSQATVATEKPASPMPHTAPATSFAAQSSYSPSSIQASRQASSQLNQAQNAYSWYAKVPGQVSQTFPMKPLTFAPKFGMFCGVCPICVAGMAAQRELDNIRKMKQADAQDGTIKFVRGAAMGKIRQSGTSTGSKLANIGNDDGTRLQELGRGKSGEPDSDVISNAALPRVYATPDATEPEIVVNPARHSSRGVDNGLYKKIMGGLQQKQGTGQTDRYELGDDADDPLMQANVLQGLKQEIRTYGIYHHINESRDARRSGMSQPLLCGYTALTTLKPGELFVPSVRELPGFEGGGIDIGGLMNAMGMAVKAGSYKTVVVQVENWQTELKDYLETLQKERGYTVTEIPPKDTPRVYEEFLKDQNLGYAAPKLYRIELGPLQSVWENRNPNNPPGQQDTALLATIMPPDPKVDEAEMRRLLMDQDRFDACPPINTITLLSGLLPEPDELVVPDIPKEDRPNPTLQKA